MKKKILAMLLAVVMIMAMLPTAFAAEDGYEDTDDDVLLSAPAESEDVNLPISIKTGDTISVEQAETLYCLFAGSIQETKISGFNVIESGSKITVSHTGNDESSYIYISYDAYTRSEETRLVTIEDYDTEETETVDMTGKYYCNLFNDGDITLCKTENTEGPSTPDGEGHYWMSGRFLPGLQAGQAIPDDYPQLILHAGESVTFTLPDDGIDTIYVLTVSIYYPQDQQSYYQSYYIKIDDDLYNSKSEDEEPTEPENSDFVIEDGVLIEYTGEGGDVTIPDGVTAIGGEAFYNCTALTGVTIPDSVTTIGGEAFSRCFNLTSVTIGDGVTTIGDNAFAGCDSLTSLTIGDSVTTIGNSAFSSCGLTSVTIPDSVTTIGISAFANCNSLTEVTIPAGVTAINDMAFWACSKLTSITVEAADVEIGDMALGFYMRVYYNDEGEPVGAGEAVLDGVTIYGYAGSTAETYAEENGITFVALDAESEEPTEPENPFTDVPEGAWYADSVNWAVEKGITTGTNAEGTTFDPTRDCVDLEILTFLYRADSDESTGDGGDMDRAVDWARENGLIGEDYDATAECTRATAVWYIWKVLGADDTAPAYSFTDVDADAEYAAAVNWAVAKGVTNGSEDGTTFSPSDPCSRGMIVTFLYRAYANSVSE